MPYIVDIGPLARADMRAAYTSIAKWVYPSSANRWYRGIIAKIRTLKNDPQRWPLADEAADLGFDLRMLLHGRGRHVYRILYTIDDDTVNVLRVRHAAMDSLTEDDV